MFLASNILNNTLQPQNDFNTLTYTSSGNVFDVLINFGILGRIQLDAIPSPIPLPTPDTPTTVIFNGFIDPTVTIFDTPIPSLSYFDIQLINPDGSYYLCDFSSFALEFTTYIDSGLNTNISSRRGIQDKTSYESELLMS